MKLEYFFFGIFALLLAATGMLAMHYRGELQYERRLNDLRKQAPAVPVASSASPAATAGGGVVEAPVPPATSLQREIELAEAEKEALAARVRGLENDPAQPTATETQNRIQQAPVVARITDYKPDYGVAALDQGSNQLLKTGQVYAVRRGQYLIAKKLTIGELVEATECAAVVEASSLQPGEELRPGDEVIKWE